MEEERERNIERENYTRRENIKLMNIPGTENRNITTRDLAYDISSRDQNVDTNDIRFLAVHRVGKPSKSRIGPLSQDLSVERAETTLLELREGFKSLVASEMPI